MNPECTGRESTIAALQSRSRLAGFDGLRAIAALAIAVYHVDFIHLASHVQHGPIAQFRVGVWVFFALSGFLLYRTFVNSHLDGRPVPILGDYFRNRVLRIYPAYWMALIFFVWIHRAPLDPGAGVGGVIRQFTLTQVYRNFADTVRGLPQTWSLAAEVAFYLALPIYAYVLRRLGRRFGVRAEYAGIVTIFALWLAWTTATRGNAIDQQWLPNFAMAFGVGMLMAVVATDAQTETRIRKVGEWLGAHGVLSWLGAAIALIVRWQLHISPRYENALESQLLYAATAVLLVAPVVFAPAELAEPAAGRQRRSVVMALLDNPVARFLGRISYGIFLWHYYLIVVVHDDWFQRTNGNVNELALLAVAIPLTIAVATLSWYLVEQPILRAGRVARGHHMSFRAALTVITGAALSWRVLYVLAERGRLVLNGDAFYYHWQAIAVARGLGFIDPVQWRTTGHIQQSAGHPPAYILYLAAFTKFGMSSETAHRLASCLLGAATVCVLGLAGRALARAVFPADSRHPELIGLVAAALAGAYANLWINDEMLMSESMAALGVAVVLLAFIAYRERPSWRTAAALGGAVGFAAMGRAELLALAVLVIVPLVLARHALAWAERIRQLAIAAVVVLVIIMPWVGYNLSRFHHPVYMSNGLGGVALVGNCHDTYYGPFLGYWSATCGGKLATQLFGDESDREIAWRHAGYKYLDDHLGRFPVVALARAGRMWDVFRPTQNASLDGSLEGRGVGASKVAEWQYAFLAPIAIAGLLLLRRRRVMVWPYLMIAALATFTAITSFGITRYRIAVDVMLPLLAAVAVVEVSRACTARLRTD
jgi:peptidoglycan/LPS O-acetylase OafA/YrhL